MVVLSLTKQLAPRTSGDIDKIVGYRLSVRRKALGLSLAELGRHVGVSFQQIRKYERGENRIGAGRLLQFAETLDVPVGYFYGDGDEPTKAAAAHNTLHPIVSAADIDALSLMDAFEHITSPKARRAVLQLARSLSEAKD
jgi:transcriptional regulator with XRE-family HTH domain